jgi:hypothetical protein
MRFNFTALNTGIILQLSSGGIKSIAYSNIDIFMSLFVMMLPANDYFFARRGDVNADMVEITLVMMLMFSLYSYSATHDMRVEFIELAGFFADFSFYRLRGWYSAKSDLYWDLHVYSLLQVYYNCTSKITESAACIMAAGSMKKTN